jgi:hypothetical protein
MIVSKSNNGVRVRAYQGDAMSFLAFDVDKAIADNKTFVGFSIACTPAGRPSRFLLNRLSFTAPPKADSE